MAAELHFSDTVYGFGAGVFFVSYCLAQFPSNLILQKIGARAWLGGTMIVWGAISAATMAVRTPGAFYSLRLLLGLAEGGFFPGAIFYLTIWFPAPRRGAIISSFMTAIALSGIGGSPLSGWIMDSLAGHHGWNGWKWLFLIEGIPAVTAGLLVLILLPDSIRSARWLSADEKSFLEDQVGRPPPAEEPLGSVVGQTLRNRTVWLFILINFTTTIGLYGIGFWMPQIIADAGISRITEIGMLGAIPYLAAIVAMVAIGRHSDAKAERKWHMALSVFSASTGLLLIALAGRSGWVAVSGLSLATAGVLSANPLFWAWTTSFLHGTAAAVGIGIICAMGNIAGFFGPFLMGAIRDATRGPATAVAAIAACLFLSGLLMLGVPAQGAPKISAR